MTDDLDSHLQPFAMPCVCVTAICDIFAGFHCFADFQQKMYFWEDGFA